MTVIIPFRKAMWKVFISTLLISGIPWALFSAFIYLSFLRMNDPQYEIVALVQHTSDEESLKTAFIAELLQLSQNQPVNLYKFDLASAKEKLLNFPLITKASLKRIPPGILSIDYELRKPVALLGDVSNTVVDDESYSFPLHPFFSPKKLPIFITGLDGDQITWGKKILDERLSLAFQVMKTIDSLGLSHDVVVDVSSVDVPSLGMRKIVVLIGPHDVILDPADYKNGLNRYKMLLGVNEFNKTNAVAMIDLRLPKLGYVK